MKSSCWNYKISYYRLKFYPGSQATYQKDFKPCVSTPSSRTNYLYTADLGPILFSIYIDLPTAHKNCSSRIYIDDTKLNIPFPIQESSSVQTMINTDLFRIPNWCFDNYLLLNLPKTKLMLFENNRMISKIPNFRLSLMGKWLLPVTSAKTWE